MRSRQPVGKHRSESGHAVAAERLQEITGSSWDLTFMQNQMEKGKVTMMKSSDVRTRSHSKAPKPEDLVP